MCLTPFQQKNIETNRYDCYHKVLNILTRRKTLNNNKISQKIFPNLEILQSCIRCKAFKLYCYN
jgi:hypothetical protein